MSTRTVQRATRMGRIARIGEALASVAEGAAADRRRSLFAEQNRLETVQRYVGDYGTLVRDRETTVQSASSLRLYRDFSGWLTDLSEKQQNEVAQGEFLLDSALEEARQKRGFADALEHVSERARKSAQREADAEEQKTLDGLAQRTRPRQLGTEVATTTDIYSNRQEIR